MKNNKGITLIALVISIIVLLILSGVSINATVGENGILTRAQNAVTETARAEFEEQAEMILFEAARMKMDGATDDEIKAYLLQEFSKLGKRVVVNLVGDEWLVVCDAYTVQTPLDGVSANTVIAIENVGTSSEWTVLYDEEGYLTIIGSSYSSGALRIPRTITYEKTDGTEAIGIVKQIGASGYNVFSYRMGLTSITIPEGVQVIYNNAFYECTGLNCEINFPSTLTTIGDYAFYNCSGLTGNIINKLENSNITSVGSYAFYGCSGLTGELKLFTKISLGAMAFAACEQITGDINVLLVGEITEIPDGAFSGMSGLSGTLSIPSTVTRIGNYAFYNCSGLSGTLTIPSGCTEIGDYAFYSCTGFTLLSIDTTSTGKLQTIGSYAFYSCSGFTNNGLSFPSTLTALGEYCFCKTTGVSGTLTVPSGITEIPAYAFNSCSGISTISFSSSLTSIGNNAFYRVGLSGTLTLPSTITKLDAYCFSQTTITTVIFGSGIETISNYAFSKCSNLSSIVFSNTITNLGVCTFRECTSLTSLTIPSNIKKIDGNCFDGCTSLSKLGSEETSDIVEYLKTTYVTSIGNNAFANCSLLTGTYYNKLTTQGGSSTASPATLTLGTAIFSGTQVVVTIDLADGLTLNDDGTYSIIKSAYSGATNLTGTIDLSNVKLEDGTVAKITKIGDYAFYKCTEITGITFGSDIKTIGKSAFYGCSNLKSISLPNSIKSIGTECFRDCESISTVDLPSTLTELPSGMFYSCKSLTSIDIPDSVTSVGYRCFFLSGLESVTIPSLVTSIGEGAFAQTGSLSSVTFVGGESTLSFSSGIFSWDTGLESVEFPENLTELPASTLESCSKLTSVTFKGTITSLGNKALRSCSGLTSITFEKGTSSINSIGDYCFQNCSSLKLTLSLPSTVSIGVDAFDNISEKNVTYGN